MTVESSYRRFGDFKQPVQASEISDGQLFSVFDPAIDRLIDFFKTVLVAELGDAWDAVKVTLTNDKLRDKSVVEDVIWTQPRKSIFREGNYDFPLLAIYRTEETHDLITLRERRAIVTVKVDYILPPLPLEDERRIGGVLNAVNKCLATALEDMGHPAYNNGLAVFFYEDSPRDAIFAAIEMKRVKYGRAEFGDDGTGLEFPMVQMTVEAVEHDGHLSEGPNLSFDSVHGRLHVGGSEGNIEDLVEFEAPVEPV